MNEINSDESKGDGFLSELRGPSACTRYPDSSVAVRSIVPFSAWLLGILIFFHPTLISGFGLIQGGPADSRWNNFVLEHTFRWLTGHPNHEVFFYPPVNYPMTIMHSTDLLLGLAPIFWLWRLTGMEPDTAYQLWMMSLATLNFLACYLLLKHSFRLSVLASSLSALLFAFNTAQSTRIVHQQLVSQLFLILSVLSLCVIFRAGSTVRNRNFGILTFFASVALQFYTSFNGLFFMSLAFLGAFVWAWIIPSWRSSFLGVIRRHYICLAIGALMTLAVIWPLLNAYVQQALATNYGMASKAVLPKPYIWLLTGKGNLLYGWIRSGPFNYLTGNQFSQGIGFVTSLLAFFGLSMARTRTSVKVVLAGFLTAVLMVTHLTNEIGFWVYLRDVIPGAKAIRAPCRIGMIQMIPAAIGLGFFFQRMAGKKRLSWLVLLAAFCMLEQVHLIGPRMSKQALREEVAELAEQVDPNCFAFALVPVEPRKGLFETSAWTVLASGKPAINRRAGSYQSFREKTGSSPEALLKRWGQRHNQDTSAIQLIKLKPRQRIEPQR